MRPRLLLSLTIAATCAVCGFCGYGAWVVVGRDLMLSLPDGSREIETVLVAGPPTREIFAAPDGGLVRWTLDDEVVTSRGKRRFEGLRSVDVAGSRSAILTDQGRIETFEGLDLRPLAKIQIKAPRGEYAAPFNVAISQNGAFVAVADDSNDVFQWNARTGRLIGTRHLDQVDRILDVAYLPDGTLWAEGDRSGGPLGAGAYLEWPLRGASTQEATRGRRGADRIEIGPGGRFVGKGWEIDPGGSAWEAVLSPDGKWAALSMSGNVGLWAGGRTAVVDAATGRNLVWLVHPAAPMTTLAWWKGKLIVGGHEGYLGLFDPVTGRRTQAFTGHSSNVIQALVIEKTLYSVDDLGQVRSCDLGRL